MGDISMMPLLETKFLLSWDYPDISQFGPCYRYLSPPSARISKMLTLISKAWDFWEKVNESLPSLVCDVFILPQNNMYSSSLPRKPKTRYLSARTTITGPITRFGPVNTEYIQIRLSSIGCGYNSGKKYIKANANQIQKGLLKKRGKETLGKLRILHSKFSSETNGFYPQSRH